MADKKVSVLLSAKDALSPAFTSADKSLNKMRNSATEVGAALGNLKKQQGDVQAHLKSQQALKETNRKLAENKKRLDASGAALRESQAEQRRYQKGIAGAEETLRKLDVELARNGKLTSEQRVAHVRATQSLEQLRPAYKKASAEVAVKRREDKAATREMTSLTTAADKERTRLQSLGSVMKKTGVDTRNLAKEQARLTTDTAKASASLLRQETRIMTINKAQAKMAANREVRQGIKSRAMGGVMTTAVTAAPFVAAGKKAVEYEYAWADVQKVVSFKNAKEDHDLKMAARAQASKLGVGQTGMTEILAAAGQAGVANGKDGKIDTKQLLRFGVDASKMAIAFDTDAGAAGDTMAKMRTSMKLNQDQMIDMANYINQVSNTMAAKPMEIAAVMRRQGANAMKAGLSGKQAAAFAGTLIAGGEQEDTAATALKNITGRLTKGFAATKQQKRSLSMLGFDPGVLAKDMQKDAAGTILNVLDKINKQSPDKQKAIISDIFGEEVAGAVAKLTTNMDALQGSLRMVGDKAAYADSMEKEYVKKAATRKVKMDKLRSSVEDMEIALGDMLLPVIDYAAPRIQKTATAFSALLKNSESARTTLKAAAAGIAGLIALKVTVGTFKWIKTLGSDLLNAGKIAKAKLGGASDHTATSANRAAAALERMNRQMDRMGGRGGTTGDARSSGGRKGKKGQKGQKGQKGKGGNGRVRPAEVERAPATRSRGAKIRSGGKGLFGAVASYVIPFAATYGLDYVQRKFSGDDSGDVPTPGDASRAVADAPPAMPPGQPAMAGMLPELSNDVNYLQAGVQVASPFIKGAGRMFTPLALAGGAINTASVVMNGGSAAEIGGAVGNTGGMLAGATMGAAIGTAILPGIGTAVGGAIGGLAGSELGQKMGEVVGPYIKEGWEGIKGWFSSDDKPVPASDKVPKVQPKDLTKISDKSVTPAIDSAVAKAKSEQSPPVPEVHITVENKPHFDIKASGDPAQDNALAKKIEDILQRTQTKALHEALASGVDARMNASLSGQRSD
ncbi:phage tail tape measure protein [Scandinavium manionii]|uniref:phage tail tape measure protein n=1 Tax=Scandinavium manionii TaxID=2926520 RepID=UPI0021653E86|nr:phage tail tape measure protein [Scandinavium manionii]MCS2168020.1 phage tail tape measure protein [Scandinavium manionii]